MWDLIRAEAPKVIGWFQGRMEFWPRAAQPSIQRVNAVESDIPAVPHAGYSARVPTVSADTNPSFHRLISRVVKARQRE